MTLEEAFKLAARNRATHEKPVVFTAESDTIPCVGRIIPKGSECRVWHGENHGYVIWVTPEGKRHITYVD